MKIVADLNIYLTVILDEPKKKKIIDSTREADLIAPVILPYEIGNALSALHKRNRLNKRQIKDCYSIFHNIPVRLVDIDIKTALAISADYGMAANGAYYLETAKRNKCSFLSLDRGMTEAAAYLGIPVLEV